MLAAHSDTRQRQASNPLACALHRGQLMGQHAAMYQAMLASKLRISGPGAAPAQEPSAAAAAAVPSQHADPLLFSPPDSPGKETGAVAQVVITSGINVAKFAAAVAAHAAAAGGSMSYSRGVATR